jgi:alpha-beta hydrolase superfamily lysophospholipase
VTTIPPEDPAELDAWLSAREAAFGDVREEADARIIWAGGARRRTPLALVYLHGYSASRRETAPLCDELAERLGANLFYARLAGHGRHAPEAMGEASAACWRRDAEEAFEIGTRLGERVVLVGCSTGATLATLVAAEAPEALAACVLIAPNYGPRDPRTALLTWPGARRWVPWVIGRERVVEAENDAHARFWTLRYPTPSLVPMMELVQQVRRADLGAVTSPVLAVWCEQDEVVDAARIPPTLARLRAAHVETMLLEAIPGASNHVVVGDAFAPDATAPVRERILAFLAGTGVVQGGAEQSASSKNVSMVSTSAGPKGLGST